MKTFLIAKNISGTCTGAGKLIMKGNVNKSFPRQRVDEQRGMYRRRDNKSKGKSQSKGRIQGKGKGKAKVKQPQKLQAKDKVKAKANVKVKAKVKAESTGGKQNDGESGGRTGRVRQGCRQKAEMRAKVKEAK